MAFAASCRRTLRARSRITRVLRESAVDRVHRRSPSAPRAPRRGRRAALGIQSAPDSSRTPPTTTPSTFSQRATVLSSVSAAMSPSGASRRPGVQDRRAELGPRRACQASESADVEALHRDRRDQRIAHRRARRDERSPRPPRCAVIRHTSRDEHHLADAAGGLHQLCARARTPRGGRSAPTSGRESGRLARSGEATRPGTAVPTELRREPQQAARGRSLHGRVAAGRASGVVLRPRPAAEPRARSRRRRRLQRARPLARRAPPAGRDRRRRSVLSVRRATGRS